MEKVNKHGKSIKSPLNKAKYLYKKQIYRSKDRGHNPPKYSLQEFLDYCLTSFEFLRIYKDYENNNYDKNLCPSVDRLENDKGYSFDNIRIVTWYENNKKGWEDRAKGKNGAVKPVLQICKSTGKILANFFSIAEAERQLGLSSSHIVKCLKGKLKTHGGYKWKYAS